MKFNNPDSSLRASRRANQCDKQVAEVMTVITRSAVARERVYLFKRVYQVRPEQLKRRATLFHRGKERVTPSRPAVALELGVLVCGHGEGLLLHGTDKAATVPASDLISVALTPLVVARRGLDEG